MGIKVTEKCGRCRRSEDIDVADFTAAATVDEKHKKKAERAEEIRAFLEGIPVEERPDLVAVAGETLVLHTHLCSSGGPKSNCEKRVGELLTDMDVRAERKPRAKKSGESAES